VSTGQRFQDQVTFNVSDGRTYQPPGKAPARCAGNWSVRRFAYHGGATPSSDCYIGLRRTEDSVQYSTRGANLSYIWKQTDASCPAVIALLGRSFSGKDCAIRARYRSSRSATRSPATPPRLRRQHLYFPFCAPGTAHGRRHCPSGRCFACHVGRRPARLRRDPSRAGGAALFGTTCCTPY
jgi:hypothetical protein